MPDPVGFPSLVREALSLGRSVTIRARGHSMRPLIPDGSLVEIVPLPRSPRVGDVLALGRGRHLVVHRVHAVTEAGVVTMGDGGAKPDRPFEPCEILGIVRRVETPRGLVMRLDGSAARLLGRVIVALLGVRPGRPVLRRFF